MKRKREFDDANPRKSKKIKLAKIPFEINKDFIPLLRGDEDLKRLRKMSENERDNELFHRWERRVDELNGVKINRQRKSPNHSSSSYKSKKRETPRKKKKPVNSRGNRRNESYRNRSPSKKTKKLKRMSNEDLKYLAQPIFDFSTFQRVCVTRNEILKHIDEPYFDRFIKGTFVRIFLGCNSIGEAAFRLAQVDSIHPVTPGYRIDKKVVYNEFVLRIGKRTKRMRLDTVSNEAPKSEEYLNYVLTLENQRYKILSNNELLEHYLKNIRGIENRYTGSTSHHEINKRMKEKIERKEFTNLPSFQLDQLRLRLANRQELLKEQIGIAEQKKIVWGRKKKKKMKIKIAKRKSFVNMDEDEDDNLDVDDCCTDEIEYQELKDELEEVKTDIINIINEKKRRKGDKVEKEDKFRKINERNRRMNKKISKNVNNQNHKIVPPPPLHKKQKHINQSSRDGNKINGQVVAISENMFERAGSKPKKEVIKISPPESKKKKSMNQQMEEEEKMSGSGSSHTTSPPIKKLDPFARTDTKSSFWGAALGVDEDDVDIVADQKAFDEKELKMKKKKLREEKGNKAEVETHGNVKIDSSLLLSFEEIPIDFD